MAWNRKRPAFVLAAMVVAVAVSGCGGSSPANDGSYSFAFVPGVAGDEFYITMQCGIQQAVRAAGAKVNVQGPAEFDPILQKPIIDSEVARKPDVLLVAPTDATAMRAPLKAAAKAGVKVILVDTTLDDPTIAASEIASDNEGGGAAAFEAIKAKNPHGGKLLVISVDPGISTMDARVKGFRDAIAKDPSFSYAGVQYSDNQPQKAAELTTAALQKDPDIVGIFATNLFAAEGTATGLRQAGKTTGVTVAGFDAGPGQVKALKEGAVQALIAQRPSEIGADGVAQALNALKGKPVEKKIQTGFTIITKDNVDTDAKQAIYKSSCSARAER